MNTFKHLFDTGKVIYESTSYGGCDLEIRDATENGLSVRLLLVDGARESASFNEKRLQNELVFKYAEGFNEVFKAAPHLTNTLLIGGAGFSYPKYYISHFPEKSIDVVEIDKEMVHLAFEYFYLSDLFHEYDLYENNRLNIFVMDGKDYLLSAEKKYDVIINDAYIAYDMDAGLLHEDAFPLIKSRLTEGGVYVLNMITAVTGDLSIAGKKEMALFKSHFSHTSFVRCTPTASPKEKQNCLLIGSDAPL